MKHIHADLMAAYAADAQTTATPFDLWECLQLDTKTEWFTLKCHPAWNTEFLYRRKTNEQIIHVLLWQAHEQLEEISAEICALNLDGIQDLLAQVRELVQKPDENLAVKPHPNTRTVTLNTEQLKEVIMACGHVGWENEDFTSGVAALKNALGGEA